MLNVGAPAPGTSHEQERSSLGVAPGVYVAREKMTFTGTIGGRSRKAILLQFHTNRPGDRWTNVDGFSALTDAAGRFRFCFPAPAMWGISYCIISKRAATRPWTFRARSQGILGDRADRWRGQQGRLRPVRRHRRHDPDAKRVQGPASAGDPGRCSTALALVRSTPADAYPAATG
jgi:hypothetical protein